MARRREATSREGRIGSVDVATPAVERRAMAPLGLDLGGVSVLIVQAKGFTSTYVISVIEDAGAHIVGPHETEAAAIACVVGGASRIAVAIIDTDLSGCGFCLALAAELASRDIPTIFLSKRVCQIPEPFRRNLHLQPPFAGFQVVEAIAALLGGRG
jgi:hypothetical protein